MKPARRAALLHALRAALVLIVTPVLLVSLRILWLRDAYPRPGPSAPTSNAPWGRPFQGPQGPFSVAGAVHVHTDVSADARVPLADVVTAARDAGLSFLVLTEHDAAHPLGARAVIRDGILLVAGVEWSTSDGHLLDFSPVPEKGPFATGAQALAACRRTGGPCVVAHPTSWRRQWLSAWPGADGLEIHSSMAAVGDQLRPPFVELAWTAWQTLLNPALGLWPAGAAQERALWTHEAYAQVQPLSGWCGADLHGHLPLQANLLGFLTVVGRAQAFSADPEAAAREVVEALQHGTCVNALAGWVDGLQLDATGDRVRARGRLAPAAGDARLVLLKDSVSIREAPLGATEITLEAAAARGTYRAEIRVNAPGFVGAREHTAAVRLLRVEDEAAR